MSSINRILSIGICLLLLSTIVASVSATTEYVDDYGGADFKHILDAIDNASAGDTIYVKDGTYDEIVDVKVKNLTIRSENGSDSTLIRAKNRSDHVFEVTADYENICKFTVRNATKMHEVVGGGLRIDPHEITVKPGSTVTYVITLSSYDSDCYYVTVIPCTCDTAWFEWLVKDCVCVAAHGEERISLNVTPPYKGNFQFRVRAESQNCAMVTETAWIYVVTPPVITYHAPESPVNDYGGVKRTFSITINQIVNVSWQINGTVVKTNESVTDASYTNTSAVIGTWNVSAIVNNANGTDMQTWVWSVTSPCFIATAAYGTALHGDIDILRDFRDAYLMPNPPGRTFVKMYYNVSPPIADVIRENKGLRTIVRDGLVKPWVYISRMFVR